MLGGIVVEIQKHPLGLTEQLAGALDFIRESRGVEPGTRWPKLPTWTISHDGRTRPTGWTWDNERLSGTGGLTEVAISLSREIGGQCVGVSGEQVPAAGGTGAVCRWNLCS